MLNVNNSDRYRRAIIRNLFELRYAISEGIAENCFYEEVPESNWSFFTYCTIALKNDVISHLIKILDTHKDAVSFWYIYDKNKLEIDNFINFKNIPFDKIQMVSEKLKTIRDKTHFHIDKKAVFNPRKLWEDVAVKGTDIKETTEYLWEILNYLHKMEYGDVFSQSLYDGKDIKSIVAAIRNAGIEI